LAADVVAGEKRIQMLEYKLRASQKESEAIEVGNNQLRKEIDRLNEDIQSYLTAVAKSEEVNLVKDAQRVVNLETFKALEYSTTSPYAVNLKSMLQGKHEYFEVTNTIEKFLSSRQIQNQSSSIVSCIVGEIAEAIDALIDHTVISICIYPKPSAVTVKIPIVDWHLFNLAAQRFAQALSPGFGTATGGTHPGFERPYEFYKYLLEPSKYNNLHSSPDFIMRRYKKGNWVPVKLIWEDYVKFTSTYGALPPPQQPPLKVEEEQRVVMSFLYQRLFTISENDDPSQISEVRIIGRHWKLEVFCLNYHTVVDVECTQQVIVLEKVLKGLSSDKWLPNPKERSNTDSPLHLVSRRKNTNNPLQVSPASSTSPQIEGKNYQFFFIETELEKDKVFHEFCCQYQLRSTSVIDCKRIPDSKSN